MHFIPRVNGVFAHVSDLTPGTRFAFNDVLYLRMNIPSNGVLTPAAELDGGELWWFSSDTLVRTPVVRIEVDGSG